MASMNDEETGQVRYSWTQPICERCWINEKGEWVDISVAEEKDPIREVLVSIQRPTLVVQEEVEVEQCAWCGEPTIWGCFTRHDPSELMFPARKD